MNEPYLLSQNLMVEKQQRVQRLVLSSRADVRISCQAGEKCRDISLAHLSRVAFVVEEDESFDPSDIGIFSFDAVVPCADRLADLIEESGLLWRRRRVDC